MDWGQRWACRPTAILPGGKQYPLLGERNRERSPEWYASSSSSASLAKKLLRASGQHHRHGSRLLTVVLWLAEELARMVPPGGLSRSRIGPGVVAEGARELQERQVNQCILCICHRKAPAAGLQQVGEVGAHLLAEGPISQLRPLQARRSLPRP